VEFHLQGKLPIFLEFVSRLSSFFMISPINDLLDKGGYTLEDLLLEDELIQEVKSKNNRLIEL
jgi:hypothetical protein